MPSEIDKVIHFLIGLQRYDLSALLKECAVSVKETKGGFVGDDWYPTMPQTIVTINAPSPIDDALRALPKFDQKRLVDAISSGFELTEEPDLEIGRSDKLVNGRTGLIAELLLQRELMIEVATGGARIQDVNDYYRAREFRIITSRPPELEYDNPHSDLWDWYRHWKEDLPSYADRRAYVRNLFDASINKLSRQPDIFIPVRELTGWERVDRTLAKARSQFDIAKNEEDFQAIGLLCREIIISLAQAVFDPYLHEVSDGVKVSKTDANRMIEAFIGHRFPGPSFKEVRSHARASLALALNLQHRRTADRQLAALCIEGTASTVAVISIIARPDQT